MATSTIKRQTDFFSNGAEIPDNSNIDSYKTSGKYFSSSAGHTATLSGDLPFTTGFTLYVTINGYNWIHQFAVKAGGIGIKHRVWIFDTSSWTNWYTLEEPV